jgi:GAF domain-containing protein
MIWMAGIDLPLADELAQLSARMTPLLLSLDTVTTAVETLTALAHQAIPGASGAGLSLLDDEGRRTSAGSTSAVVRQVDDLQYLLEEGPCLAAWADGVTVRVDDVDYDPRWPRWSTAARGLPLLSTLSAPLVAAGRTLGAVKVYSDRRAAFDTRTEHLLEGFADIAAVLLANADRLDNARELSDNLRHAISSRDTVLLATGIVMQRHQLPRDRAYQQLVDHAKTTNRNLLTVAVHTVTTTAHQS